MNYSIVNMNENVRVSGNLDVWMHNLPRESSGCDSFWGVALGIGILLSLFADGKPEAIASREKSEQAPQISKHETDAFELIFSLLDQNKNILRTNNSEDVIIEVKNNIRLILNFIESKCKSFSNFQCKILESLINDMTLLLKTKSTV